jgi:hypothetical protein
VLHLASLAAQQQQQDLQRQVLELVPHPPLRQQLQLQGSSGLQSWKHMHSSTASKRCSSLHPACSSRCSSCQQQTQVHVVLL